MRPLLSILRALDEAGVNFVVVGGVAVVLRGHARMTVDLDLALDLTTENAAAVVQVLVGCGLQPRLPVRAEDFADADLRASWVDKRHLVAFTMHDPDDPFREVDLLATSPVPYAELAADADVLTVEGVSVPVASVTHLVAMNDTPDVRRISLTSRPCRLCTSPLSWAWMDTTPSDGRWRGTSDAPATVRARAQSSPAQRLAWLEESLTLAMASGALGRDRSIREEEAEAWAKGNAEPTPNTSMGHPS